jgi:RNA polymerase sigma-70 factor (ECF subfamily)
MADERAAMEIVQLVADHHRVVFGYAYRLTGSVQDAEDLTQQTFLTAQRKLEQLRGPESARSWLLTILRNFFLKDCQKRRPRPAADFELDVDTIPEQTSGLSQVDGEQLQEALDALPPDHRLMLVMFYYEGCSYREIAERLELPMGTVMSRLARAKGRLRRQLASEDRHADVNRQPNPAIHQG